MTERSCHLAEGFSTGEKILSQVTFHGFWITGFIAIWPESAWWALAYAALVLYGVLGLIVRHWVCPRCPHLHKYNDCVQVSPLLTKWLVKKPTTTSMSKTQRALVILLFVLIPLFPQYWLWQKPMLLAVFWVFCAAWYAALLLHLCKQCRVSSCPFNRAGGAA